MSDVVLHPGRDRSLRRRHPWLLASAVAAVEGEAEPGALVRVRSAEGEVLGFGHLSPASSLRLRIWSLGKEPPPEDLLERRIAAAVASRRADPTLAATDALRLVNAEGDDLPGLVADRYAEALVLRFTSPGLARLRERVVEALREATGVASCVERADGAACRREGMPVREGPVFGAPPARPLWIRENGRRYAVDALAGQKTGFYLDQRGARDLVARLAPGRRVLDLFSYTGGFGVAAAAGGAEAVTLVDSSAGALALARESLAANAPGVASELRREDAFQVARQPGPAFDLVVADPPPLARRRADVPRAARAYKDLVLHALRRTAPGGWLLVFSCSHHVGAELFRKIVAGAARDAGRAVRILQSLGAASDHPVSVDHPEGEYLTGLWLSA